MLIAALGIDGEQDLDAAYLRCLVEQAKWSGLDRVVLLGQDGIYRPDGTRGARVLKIHSPIQRMDVSDPRHRPFFRACAKHDVLVMVHTGHEHSAPIFDIDLANLRRLEQALGLRDSVRRAARLMFG